MRIPNSRTPVGVDLTPSSVMCVRAEWAGRTGRVHAYALAPRTSQDLDETAALVAGLIQRHDMGTRRVVLSAPEDRLLTGVLELPARASGAPIELLAANELARTHKVDAASLQLAAWELPLQQRAGEGASWLVTALPKDHGAALTRAMEGAGLIVEAIDLRSLSVARACGADIDTPDALTPILQLERAGHSIAVVFGGEMVYERRLEGPQLRSAINMIEKAGVTDFDLTIDLLRGSTISGGPLEDGLLDLASQVQLALSRHATELLQQLRLSIAYVAQMIPQAALNRVLITGELARCAPITGPVSEGLTLECRVCGPIMSRAGTGVAAAAAADDTGVVHPELTCALGLALSAGIDVKEAA